MKRRDSFQRTIDRVTREAIAESLDAIEAAMRARFGKDSHLAKR